MCLSFFFSKLLCVFPKNITLDQSLNIVPIFKDKVITSRKRPEALKVEVCNLSPGDVDCRVPTINLKFQGKDFTKVLLDGGSGVNILPEGEFLKLKQMELQPAPFQVRMADQRRV